VIFVLGIPASMSLEVLGIMDAVFGNVLLMAGGLLIAVLMGWVVPTLFLNDLKDSDASSPQIRRVLIFCLQWISLVVIAAGLLISVVDLLRTWFAAP
jgi:NSS family neurotransmitter:Na+ symporter